MDSPKNFRNRFQSTAKIDSERDYTVRQSFMLPNLEYYTESEV